MHVVAIEGFGVLYVNTKLISGCKKHYSFLFLLFKFNAALLECDQLSTNVAITPMLNALASKLIVQSSSSK